MENKIRTNLKVEHVATFDHMNIFSNGEIRNPSNNMHILPDEQGFINGHSRENIFNTVFIDVPVPKQNPPKRKRMTLSVNK